MPNNSQVAHLWANKSRERARGHNLYFDGDTIYSYGSHFPIARHISRGKQSAVLFTTKTYSVSTSKHISYTHRALNGLSLPVFNVQDIRGNAESAVIKADYQSRVKAETETAARSRLHAEMYLERAQNLAQEANECAAFFGWKWRLDVPTLDPAFIAKVRERAKEETAKQRKAKEERERAAAIILAGKVSEWRAGKPVSLWDYRGETLLRINGDKIETSRGAHIPVEHAPRLWKVIQRAKAGTPYQHNGHSEHAGEFKVDSIDTNGTLRAGCHTILYGELARIAAELGIA